MALIARTLSRGASPEIKFSTTRNLVYNTVVLDGTGYPRGLEGKQIPLGARIVAVANTLDSICSDLPYRPARTLAVARQEIQHWAGRQFDPEVVGIFQQKPDAIFEELRRAIRAQIEQ
ncbi:MAG TPA: HD domain-containing phosphohydrolase [Candidatus Sulfotelmatobacter sp.]|nr:HD domain-containing phosphohydrolase [Candidatus Sulfotelmatobacter sp.]